MANLSNQQTWVPYETTKDCSQGLCSIYCPQWCYIIFPPPPPFQFADEDSPSGPAFSPLVIAIIGILASAFLLVTYYTLISRYCGRLDFFRRQLRHHSASVDDPDTDPENPSGRHEGWHVPPSHGLDEALINKISMYRYKRGEGVVDVTDCSVCLSEFREDESLRLLPKCSHAFHVHCIDTWLKSHSNCPLCRANIVSASPAPPLHLPAPPEPQHFAPPASETQSNNEVVLAIEEDSHRSGEEETPLEDEGDVAKDSFGLEEQHDIVEIREEEGQSMRRSFSMDSSHRGRVSIADVLRLSMEDELLAAKDHGFVIGAGSSTLSKGGGRSRGLHCVLSPVPMKRSFSSGRFCFTRQGRVSNSVLPL